MEQNKTKKVSVNVPVQAEDYQPVQAIHSNTHKFRFCCDSCNFPAKDVN